MMDYNHSRFTKLSNENIDIKNKYIKDNKLGEKMGVEELSEELKKSNDRIEILRNLSETDAENINMFEFINIIKTYLNDEEKEEILVDEKIRKNLKFEEYAVNEIIAGLPSEIQDKLIRNSEFMNSINLKKYWLEDLISKFSERQILSILNDKELTKTLKLEHESLAKIISKMADKTKLDIINNPEITKKLELDNSDFDIIISKLPQRERIKIFYDIEEGKELNFGLTGAETTEIIKLFPEEERLRIIENRELTNKLKFQARNFADIILSLPEMKRISIIRDEKSVKEMNLTQYNLAEIIESLSENETLNILNDNELLKRFDLYDFELANILKKIPIEKQIEFLENDEFMIANKSKPFSIVKSLSTEQQVEIVKRIMSINIPDIEKREILATLDRNVKSKIDTRNLPSEYVTALNFQTNSDGKIDVDFDGDLEQYREYDAIIKVNPEWFDDEGRKKVLRLCAICPNAKITNALVDDRREVNFESTGQEYTIGEEWVESVIDKLKPEYSLLQKIAIIDNEVGKRISYSPDFDTEVFVPDDSRTLWRIIATKHGVCNGIASVERYLINRAGLESELVSSENHTFIKLNDIEIPTEDGTIKRGSTIIDPTWNLTNHKLGAKPENLFISYEEARKHDIDSKGKDHKAHQNDKKLSNVTLTISDKALRELFLSLNLIKEDGSFPINEFLNKSKEIDKRFKGRTIQNIEAQFQLIINQYPELIRNENEIMTIMENVLDNKNIEKEAERIVINRVYDRNDVRKAPVMYAYIKGKKFGEFFYVVNESTGSFDKMGIEGFTKKYDCYEQDLQSNNGVRPWLKKNNRANEQEQDRN